MTGRLDNRGVAGLLFDHGSPALDRYSEMTLNVGSGNPETTLSELFPGDWRSTGHVRFATAMDLMRVRNGLLPKLALALAEDIAERRFPRINKSRQKLMLARTIIVANAGISYTMSYKTSLTRQVIPIVVNALTLEYLGRNVHIHKLANMRRLSAPYDIETLLKLAATCQFDSRAIQLYDIGRNDDGTNGWLVRYHERDENDEYLYTVGHDASSTIATKTDIPVTALREMIGKKVIMLIGNPYWDMLGIKIKSIGKNVDGRYVVQTDADHQRNLYALDNPGDELRLAA